MNQAQPVRAGAELFICRGGDGIYRVSDSAFGQNVVLGIIPAGRGNDFARALGLPRSLARSSGALASHEPSIREAAYGVTVENASILRWFVWMQRRRLRRWPYRNFRGECAKCRRLSAYFVSTATRARYI